MKFKILALVVLVAVGVGAAAFATGAIGASAAGTPQFLTANATVGDVTDEVAATGALAAAESYGLMFGADPYLAATGDTPPTSDVTWPVTDVAVNVGDAVAAGDVLATADAAGLDGDLDTATADLRASNINLAIANEALDAATTTDTERQAKLALYSAENQHTQALEARTAIQDQIKAAVLKSPIAGIVTEVNVQVGFDAPAGAAIVVASTTYEVTTDVVESDLADIELGQTASVAIGALGTDIEGTVTAISPVASEATTGVVAFPVTITLTVAPPDARAGMSADVTITIASAAGVLTVPSAAIQGTDGNYVVMTLAADGTAQRTPVDVGLLTSSTAEITSGLAEGTAVVTGTASAAAGAATTGAGPLGGGIRIPGGGGGGGGGQRPNPAP
jgi:macrolide-specific efflux system membrane fusion protein